MNKDKQVFEMAMLITEGARPAVDDAQAIYDAGYHKASDVVEEVTDEIFKILDAEYRQYDTATLNDTLNKMYMSSRNTIIKITAELVELKKKYTENEIK